MSEKTNKSEEELDEGKTKSETSEEEVINDSEQPTKNKVEDDSDDDEDADGGSDDLDDEDGGDTVPLPDYTRTKEILFRMAEKVIGDEEALAELAEEDPKLLERLKGEFPKKFKDVKIPTKSLSEEDIQAKIDEAVSKKIESSSRSGLMDEFRKEIGMTKIEFEDIREDLEEKAKHLLSIEVAEGYGEAVLLAYKNLSPKKYKEIIEKRALKDISKRKKNSVVTGKGGDVKKFSKAVMDNYKKLGFESPEEMVSYQGKNSIDISKHIRN